MSKSFYVGAPPLLALLSPDETEALQSAAETTGYPAGALIYARGDADPALIVIRDGTVEIGNFNLDGSFAVSARMGQGFCFGEGAMLSQLPRCFSARAGSAVVIDLVPLDGYRTLVAAHPGIGEAVTRVMAERFQRLLEFVDDLRRQPLNVQVAKALLTVSGLREQHGGIGVTVDEIAGMLGVAKVAIATTLGRFERDGLLKRRPEGVEVPDRGILADWVARRTMRTPVAG